MNGFHITAVGWVLTFNSLGLSRQAGNELSRLWTDLLQARAEDMEGVDPLARLLWPRSVKLSDKTTQALGALVNRMATLSPERFSSQALHRRRDHWVLQIVFGLLLWVLTAECLPHTWPLVKGVVTTLFLMSVGVLVPTVTLWRAAIAAKYFSTKRILKERPLGST